MALIQPNRNDKIDSIIPADELSLYKSKLKKLQENGTNCWNFSIVEGFFKQSLRHTDDSTYNSVDDHFGLNKESWNALVSELNELNNNVEDSSKERYKLVFCARHGQGYHNKAIEIWGTESWDDHYSHLEGAINPETGKFMEWAPDPFLTNLGESQAKLMNESFKNEILNFNCPIPTKLFSSPFTRSAQTLYITMNNICTLNDEDINDTRNNLISKERLNPLIIENLRETIGEHLCDKRSDKYTIEKRLKGYGFEFEPNFSSEDVYYKDDWREPISDQAIRANSFLQHVFEDKYLDDKVVYCSSHSGEIKALIVATGHRQYIVPTAGMIPMLIKATKET